MDIGEAFFPSKRTRALTPLGCGVPQPSFYLTSWIEFGRKSDLLEFATAHPHRKGLNFRR